MTLRHLRIFAAVADCGSMTRAAQALHTVQPAVSTAVAELEKEYGVQLFDRSLRRLTLTPEGRRLLQKAREALQAFDGFEAAAREGQEDPTVRIGSTLTLGQTVLPRLLGALREKEHALAPTARIAQASLLEEALLSGALDFALMETAPHSAALAFSPFARDRLAVIGGRNFAAEGPISAAALAEYPLLLREKGSASRDAFDRVMEGFGVRAVPTVESQSNEALLACARAGLGLAVVPLRLAAEGLADGSLREAETLGFAFERTYGLVRLAAGRFTHARAAAYALCAGLVREEGLQ